VNGSDGTFAQGVCLKNKGATIDYIRRHDGTSTTLLLGESLLTPPGENAAIATPTRGPAMYLAALTDQTAAYLNYRPSVIANATYGYESRSCWTATGLTHDWDLTKSTQNNSEVNVGFEWGHYKTKTIPRLSDKLLSAHGSLVVVSFCDGHTQTLSTGLDYNVFKHLATPWGAGCQAGADEDRDPPTGVLDEGSF